MYINDSNRISHAKHLLVSFLFAFALLALPMIAVAKNVLIQTPLGDIEIELLEEDAPNTVANFLRYIENDRYVGSFIHRSANRLDGSDFVIQGGGFTFSNLGGLDPVPFYDPIENEFKVSNTRGTVAMAKRGGDPDSATSQWFINMADNTDLDTQSGGFTVFARVVGNGMDVADAIAALPTVTTNIGDTPVIDYTAGNNLLEENLVMTAVSVVQDVPFAMNAGLNDAWYNSDTDGQGFFITVFPDLNLVNLAWFTYDTTLPPEDAIANLGDPGHRWLNATGPIEGDRAELKISFASGGLFDTVPAEGDIVRTEDGTIYLTFYDCNWGRVEYDIPSINQQSSFDIKRIADDNIVMCEALLGE